MTTLLSHDAFHDDVGQAFNELLTLHQFATLTAESRLRVLQSLPPDLLQQALNQAMRSDELEEAKTRAT